MVRIVGKYQKIAEKEVNHIEPPAIEVEDILTHKQKKDVAKKMLQLIAIAVADYPSKIKKLLQEFNIQVSEKPKSKELIERLMNAISRNDFEFNGALGLLIHKNTPELPAIDEHDSFDPTSDIVGAVGQTASGAAGGGWVGAAIGLVSGGLGLANSAKQAKTEKEKATAMTMSSLLQYKTVQESNKGMDKAAKTKITIAIVSIVGLIGGGILLYTLTRPKGQVKPITQ